MNPESPEIRNLVPSETTLAAQRRNLPGLHPGPVRTHDFLLISAYWRILLKRRWTLLTVALIVSTLVAIVCFRTKPVYRATARVQVESETPMIQSIEELYRTGDMDDTFLQTQVEVLKSENLAWRTIEQLNLPPTLITPDKLDRIPQDERKFRLISLFKDKLAVDLTPKTRMLAVSYEDHDPRLAAKVATALVTNYIDYNFRQKYDATRQASGWMEQQLDELKAKVETSQQALVQYEREHQIVNTGEKQDVQEQLLSDLSHDLSVAEADRVQKESFYRETLANRQQMAALAHNDLLQKLEERAADLHGQYTEAVAQYGPKFPKALRLKDDIDQNQLQIEAEQQRVLDRIRKDYNAAVDREKLALATVATQKEVVGKQNQLLIQHNLLKREFESNQQLYQNLLQRLKNATVSAGLQSANIHMVDSGLVPLEPVRPKKLVLIPLGCFLGIVLGMIGAFAQEGLDHSIKSAEELESLLFLPALAVVPLERPQGSRWSLQNKAPADPLGINRKPEGQVALAVSERPHSVLAESYRSLRTSVLLSLAPNPPKVILVTSSHEGEGKTSIALNLAQSLAARKGPVLIVDADLRKGNIANVLGLDNSKGLTSVLTGADALDPCLQNYPLQPKLQVLTSGPVPPSPADLVGSDTMLNLCRELTGRYQHIVIDSPPVLAVTDATILSGMVDGVVLVAESCRTTRAGLLRTRAILDTARARILGVVLNKLDLRQEGYYGGYSYYYSHYTPYVTDRPGES